MAAVENAPGDPTPQFCTYCGRGPGLIAAPTFGQGPGQVWNISGSEILSTVPKRYEYCFISLGHKEEIDEKGSIGTIVESTESLVKRFNELGADRWHMVSSGCDTHPEGAPEYIFEREIIDA